MKTLLGLSLALYAGSSLASGGFAEVGISHHASPPCYLWNQKCLGYEYSERLNSYYLRGGYEINLSKKTSTRVSIFTLGNAHTDAIAADDEPCAMQNGQNSQNVCGPTQRYVAETSAKGISISLKYGTDYFFEFGPTLVKRKFKISTQKEGEPLHERQDLHEYSPNESIGMGYFLGVGADVSKNTYIATYVYDDNVGGQWTAGFGRTYVISVGYKFN